MIFVKIGKLLSFFNSYASLTNNSYLCVVFIDRHILMKVFCFYSC
ncbi:hypothetical protein HMPREF9720_0891 [Alistipes sp. HGB5]|nr:hypothetical protein HMPREF9720_0891 [Alistipes sp. HGB5]